CDRGHRVCGGIFYHRGRRTIAPPDARYGPSFGPLALCRWIRGAVERPCDRCALGMATFCARSLADGGDVRIYDRDMFDLVPQSGPFQRWLVRWPNLWSPVQQPCPDCTAVRDNNALCAAAPCGLGATSRA